MPQNIGRHMAMLTEKDELRHAHDNDPRWRESLYWGFVLPDASLGGVVYLRLDPNAKTVSPMILVYRRFGDVAYLFNKADAMPARLELDDVTVQGFRLKGLQPLSTCAVAFDDGASASLEFTFTGIHPPFDYARNRSGCPSPLATNRFEQAGRFEGVLRLKDETYPLSGFGQTCAFLGNARLDCDPALQVDLRPESRWPCGEPDLLRDPRRDSVQRLCVRRERSQRHSSGGYRNRLRAGRRHPADDRGSNP